MYLFLRFISSLLRFSRATLLFLCLYATLNSQINPTSYLIQPPLPSSSILRPSDPYSAQALQLSVNYSLLKITKAIEGDMQALKKREKQLSKEQLQINQQQLHLNFCLGKNQQILYDDLQLLKKQVKLLKESQRESKKNHLRSPRPQKKSATKKEKKTKEPYKRSLLLKKFLQVNHFKDIEREKKKQQTKPKKKKRKRLLDPKSKSGVLDKRSTKPAHFLSSPQFSKKEDSLKTKEPVSLVDKPKEKRVILLPLAIKKEPQAGTGSFFFSFNRCHFFCQLTQKLNAYFAQLRSSLSKATTAYFFSESELDLPPKNASYGNVQPLLSLCLIILVCQLLIFVTNPFNLTSILLLGTLTNRLILKETEVVEPTPLKQLVYPSVKKNYASNFSPLSLPVKKIHNLLDLFAGFNEEQLRIAYRNYQKNPMVLRQNMKQATTFDKSFRKDVGILFTITQYRLLGIPEEEQRKVRLEELKKFQEKILPDIYYLICKKTRRKKLIQAALRRVIKSSLKLRIDRCEKIAYFRQEWEIPLSKYKTPKRKTKN